MALQRGSNDKPLVMAMQDMLNMAGFNAGSVDGLFGPKSESAVRSFQTAAQLPITGVFDNETNMTLQGCLQSGNCPKPSAAASRPRSRTPKAPGAPGTAPVVRGTTSILSQIPTWAWVTAGSVGLLLTLTIVFPPRRRKKR